MASTYNRIVFIILLLISFSIEAREVTLTWEPNSEPDIYCYVVYWDTVSRFTKNPESYTYNSDEILHSTCSETECEYTMSIPDDNHVYYFAVTALDRNSVYTNVNLAIGETLTSVHYDAFDYAINYIEHNIDAGEISPGNDVIPVGLYGAVALDIGTDETIDIIEATDNATGYETAELAISGLPTIAENHIRLGTISAMKSDGAFTFGTTELNAENTTIGYTKNYSHSYLNESNLESDFSNEVATEYFRYFRYFSKFKVQLNNSQKIKIETNGRRIVSQ